MKRVDYTNINRYSKILIQTVWKWNKEIVSHKIKNNNIKKPSLAIDRFKLNKKKTNFNWLKSKLLYFWTCDTIVVTTTILLRLKLDF